MSKNKSDDMLENQTNYKEETVNKQHRRLSRWESHKELTEIILSEITNRRLSVGSKYTDNNDDENDDDNHSSEMFPPDTYSFIGADGPLLNLFFGLSVCFLQMVFFSLMLLNVVVPRYRSTPSDDGQHEFLPASALPIVWFTQFLAVLVYTFFADQSMDDVLVGVQTFPSLPFMALMRSRTALASVLRTCQGLLATIATIILILTSPDVKEIIINFTALNFISSFDNFAFNLAMRGDYGSALRDNAFRVKGKKLPSYCVPSKNISKLRRKLATLVVLLAMLSSCAVIVMLQSKSDYLTQRLRVEFNEATGLEEYSGCYDVEGSFDFRPNYKMFNRSSDYYNISDIPPRFGYCKENLQWVLFEPQNSNDNDACKRTTTIAYSTKSSDFDVQSTFGSVWYFSGGRPISGIQFVEKEDGWTDGQCNNFFGNGICDNFLNSAEYRYDDGDCCAATCNHVKCGLNTVKRAFGVDLDDDSRVNGYQKCKDTDMVDIIIKITDIETTKYYDNSTTTFKNSTPPFLTVDCDGVNHLSVDVMDEMKSKSEEVKVMDGAYCSINVRTGERLSKVYYSVQHRIETETINETVTIFQTNINPDRSEFQVVPKCYFDKLKNDIDFEGFYRNGTHQHSAINWLTQDKTGNSECLNPFFVERYALVVANIAGNGGSNQYPLTKANRVNHCSWSTVVCRGGHVESFSLESNDQKEGFTLDGTIATEVGLLSELVHFLVIGTNMRGSIPSELGGLSKLKRLHLLLNKISGTIPSELGNISSLEELDLYQNELTGSIPSELIRLSALYNLWLTHNELSGLVPSEFGNMVSLKVLDLNDNGLSGVVPSELGNLVLLEELDLEVNGLTGTVPSELGNLVSLVKLDLDENGFSGTVPSELGNLVSLKEIAFEKNQLSGAIPSELGKLVLLTVIFLNDNGLSGTVPSELGNLVSLTKLYLNDNGLSGTVPSELGNLVSLTKLYLYDNELSGIVPSELGNLVLLEELELDDNGLTGTVPSELGNLVSLMELYLDDNGLTGTVPSELGNLVLLEKLYLADNGLTGTVPSELGNLVSLKKFKFEGNGFNGTIPSELGNLELLEDFYLNDNGLSGTVPSEMGNLVSLEKLDLDDNGLSGTIPSELGNLVFLLNCYLGYNGLSGTVPPELGNLVSLEELDLYHNELSGTIPSELGNLELLEALSLDHNEFSGTVPSELGSLVSLVSLVLENNNLVGNMDPIFCEGRNVSNVCHDETNLTCSCCCCNCDDYY